MLNNKVNKMFFTSFAFKEKIIEELDRLKTVIVNGHTVQDKLLSLWKFVVNNLWKAFPFIRVNHEKYYKNKREPVWHLKGPRGLLKQIYSQTVTRKNTLC